MTVKRFHPVLLAGCVFFTNRAHFLWNMLRGANLQFKPQLSVREIVSSIPPRISTLRQEPFTALFGNTTAWHSKIGSLTSLDAWNSGASSDAREPISLHQAVHLNLIMQNFFSFLFSFFLSWKASFSLLRSQTNKDLFWHPQYLKSVVIT